MTWVGILIKTKNKFRYNFKDVAVTFNGLDNFLCFLKRPFLLLIYADQGVKSIQDSLVRPSSTLPPLFYARNGRWDYRPVNKWQYGWGALFGACIGFLIFFIFTNHHHPQPNAFVSQHSLNQVDATMAWALQVCNGTACMQQLAIFPTEVWVKVARPLPKLASCESKTQGVYRCIID